MQELAKQFIIIMTFYEYLTKAYYLKYGNNFKSIGEYAQQFSESEIHVSDVIKIYSEFIESTNHFVARFGIKDKVKVCIGETVVPECRITKVHFSESKVFYSVEAGFRTDGIFNVTRLQNIDSSFVFPAE